MYYRGVGRSRATGKEERATDQRGLASRAGGWLWLEQVKALLGSRASVPPPSCSHIARHQPEGLHAGGALRREGGTRPSVRLTMPLLMIQGEEDRVTPVADNTARLVQAVPQARLAMLDGCGHLPELEDPARVNALVREFLSSRPA